MQFLKICLQNNIGASLQFLLVVRCLQITDLQPCTHSALLIASLGSEQTECRQTLSSWCIKDVFVTHQAKPTRFCRLRMAMAHFQTTTLPPLHPLHRMIWSRYSIELAMPCGPPVILVHQPSCPQPHQRFVLSAASTRCSQKHSLYDFCAWARSERLGQNSHSR